MFVKTFVTIQSRLVNTSARDEFDDAINYYIADQLAQGFSVVKVSTTNVKDCLCVQVWME